MATTAGILVAPLTALVLANPDVTTQARGPTTMTSSPVPFLTPVATVVTRPAAGVITQQQNRIAAVRALYFDVDWFEKIHVLPRSIVLGNILAPIDTTIDIFNAYRLTGHYLNAFINNAGAGVSITNLPSLPYLIPPLNGLLLTLHVTTDGPATIDTTLDFVFDTGTDSVPITGTRIVMLPFEPEAPVVEHLEFLTDVLEHKDGSEQRVALRLAPRQSFELLYRREDGVERDLLDLLLFGWQDRVFGLPIWTEPSFLTAAVNIGATSVNVDSTSYGDFRVGSLAIIYESDTKFDALVISGISSTVLNFATGTLNAYSIGARVMPLRTAITKEPASEKRYANNLADIALRMCVLDNDVSLADTTGWATFNSKVLLDEPNAIEQSLDGIIERRLHVFESDSGKFSQASTWNRSRRTSAKTFISRTRARLWAIRKLLHALRGRQVSFYLPSFSKELVLNATYTSGNASISVTNVGYAKYAQNRQPKADIRIVLNNGTTFVRTITASAEAGASENLTLSSSIGQNILVTDVKRIEYYEKVRLDTDDVVIEHADANGTAKVGFPVKTVLE